MTFYFFFLLLLFFLQKIKFGISYRRFHEMLSLIFSEKYTYIKIKALSAADLINVLMVYLEMCFHIMEREQIIIYKNSGN